MSERQPRSGPTKATYDPEECRDRDRRIRRLEETVAVNLNRLANLEKLPDLISSLRDAVTEMKTLIKVTWALLLLVFGGLIGLAIAIVQSGVLHKVP